MTGKLTVTICSSANFYRQAVEIQEYLSKLGYKVIIPFTAEKMKASGDYEVSHYRTWLKDKADYHKKSKLMRLHFDEVANGDVCLVLNYEKSGIQNYVGGNVLMEMGLAFHLKKPILLINEIPEESKFLEEIIGMNPIVLHGKAEDLPKVLAKLSASDAQ